MNKEWLVKILVIGFILLFINTRCFPAVSENIEKSRNQENANDYDNSLLEVNFTRPENGIYFYDHKILPFFVPLVLCGPITIAVTVSNYYGMDIEIYINGVLQDIIIGPGPTYTWGFSYSWARFSKISLNLTAYTFNETISDEITIWRIFS